MVGHLFLIGFMGAGKSSVGQRLADRLGLAFLDLDQIIVSKAGANVTDIFESMGEQAFRQLESEALLELAASEPSVVACGGGVILSSENRTALKRMGRIVYLKVDAAEALARIGDTSTRPLLSGPAGTMAATSLLAARESLYAAIADVEIDTRGLSVEKVAAAVLRSVSGMTDT